MLTADHPGNRQTFEEFYRADYRDLVRYAMKHGARFDEAEDVVQEVMAQVYRLWPTIDSPHAWARKGVNSTIARVVGRRKREDELLLAMRRAEEIAGRARAGPPVDDGETDEVRAVLADLPETQRAVLALTIDGFRPVEIAAKLGRSPEAVRSSLREARRRLRAQLGDRMPEALAGDHQDEEGVA